MTWDNQPTTPPQRSNDFPQGRTDGLTSEAVVRSDQLEFRTWWDFDRSTRGAGGRGQSELNKAITRCTYNFFKVFVTAVKSRQHFIHVHWLEWPNSQWHMHHVAQNKWDLSSNNKALEDVCSHYYKVCRRCSSVRFSCSPNFYQIGFHNETCVALEITWWSINGKNKSKVKSPCIWCWSLEVHVKFLQTCTNSISGVIDKFEDIFQFF